MARHWHPGHFAAKHWTPRQWLASVGAALGHWVTKHFVGQHWRGRHWAGTDPALLVVPPPAQPRRGVRWTHYPIDDRGWSLRGGGTGRRTREQIAKDH